MSTMKAARPLVLCFDGTSDHYDCDNTNIVKFFELLKKDDFNEQLCYYQPGIGTWYEPGIVSPLFRWGAKLLDLGFAWYFDAHVMEGYKFIMKNYRVGDRICIFGFSRGAFTARALAAMLHIVGLLPRDNEQQVPFAYKLYERSDKDDITRCQGFKQIFCQDVKVEFVGVWDTVSSVGTLFTKSLPPAHSNDGIKTFRHALSLDEHRARFHPECSYLNPARADPAPALDPEDDDGKLPRLVRRTSVHSFRLPGFFSRLLNKRKKIKLHIKDDEIVTTDALEVWFAGCHADVGGGAVSDEQECNLSNVSLRWMVREVQKARCGILFDEEALERAGIAPLTSKDLESRNVETSETEHLDALQDIHDRLQENWLWWVLEMIPYPRRWQDKDQKWRRKLRSNLGRGRKIPDSHPTFHESVRERMNDTKLKYKPKAKWPAGSETYVE